MSPERIPNTKLLFIGYLILYVAFGVAIKKNQHNGTNRGLGRFFYKPGKTASFAGGGCQQSEKYSPSKSPKSRKVAEGDFT